MAKKTFTKEEMQIIQSNPNTLSVTEHRITLTLEAKEKILMLSKSGMPISRILNELGYDSEILGTNRIRSIISHVNQEAASKTGLHQGYKPRSKKRMSRTQIQELEENPESYHQLKNEVLYLREEVEFLKKISQEVISGKRGK